MGIWYQNVLSSRLWTERNIYVDRFCQDREFRCIHSLSQVQNILSKSEWYWRLMTFKPIVYVCVNKTKNVFHIYSSRYSLEKENWIHLFELRHKSLIAPLIFISEQKADPSRADETTKLNKDLLPLLCRCSSVLTYFDL